MSHSALVGIVLFLAWTAGAAAAEPPYVVRMSGRVLDPDDKPIERARLYWPRAPKTDQNFGEDVEFVQRAETDAGGRFSFGLTISDIRFRSPMILLAAADGYGMNWHSLAEHGSYSDWELRLVKDQSIEGRIFDAQGKPLAGVRVRAVAVHQPRFGQLDEFLADWKRDWQKAYEQRMFPPQSMHLPANEKSVNTVTDQDGRYRIRGAGVERLVVLQLRRPGMAPAALFVVNRAGFDAAPVNKAARSRLAEPPLLYGPTLSYVAAEGRGIEGTVCEIASGKAVAGFRIHTDLGYGVVVRAVSDKDGRYKLEDVPKIGQYLLFALPPNNSSWAPIRARVQEIGGRKPLRADFAVVRGVVVSGRLIERPNGKRVRGMVRFAALPGNKFFDKPQGDAYHSKRLAVWTDADGSFQLVVLPGPGMLMALATNAEKIGEERLSPYKQAEFSPKDRKRIKVVPERSGAHYLTAVDTAAEALAAAHAVKVIDLDADTETTKCDLYVERGATRIIRIEDDQGHPLMGTVASGMTATLGNTIPIPDAIFHVLALDPKRPRRLFFLHVHRNLAATLTLRGDEKQPVIVRLRRAATVTGRVLDRNGQPLAGLDVNLSLSERSGSELYRVAKHQPTARTDKNGRFRLQGIVPELRFTLDIVQGGTYFIDEPRIGVRQVKAAETLDLGDVRVNPGP